MLHRIAFALSAPQIEVRCEYVGLNHLGWVRKVELRGRDVTDQVLADDQILNQLYPVPMFDHDLIRSLRLIPTEYLYFYYSRSRALANQRAHGSSRGAEIARFNEGLFRRLGALLASDDGQCALAAYTEYLNARSGTYMVLESTSKDRSITTANRDEDPFRAANGYHRIALDVMRALRGEEAKRVIVNVRNNGAIADIGAEDVVEVPCGISRNTITSERCGMLPAVVRGLVLATKEYERATIDAVVSGSRMMARRAMLLYPAIGEWEPSDGLLRDLSFTKSELQ
jgi:6-phospho-beta-glucosidase